MEIYTMTIREYEEMLSKKEYKAITYPPHTYDSAFEDLMDYGNITNLFDDLVDSLGRVPTQTEYVNAGVERSKRYFTPENGDINQGVQIIVGNYRNQRMHTFYWNEPMLQTAVKKRLSRTYPSLLAEVGLIIYMREVRPDLFIAAHPDIDIILGVDAVAFDRKLDKALYFHVTGASSGGTSFLKKKAGRKGYAKRADGTAAFYTRKELGGHVHLAFNKFNEDISTKIINGNPVFKAEYLEKVLELAFKQDDLDKATGPEGLYQLRDLANWLVTNQIKPDGLPETIYVFSVNTWKEIEQWTTNKID